MLLLWDTAESFPPIQRVSINGAWICGGLDLRIRALHVCPKFSRQIRFWQNGFFADFYFCQIRPPDFFADFVAGLFLLIFVGKSAQKNPPGKSLAKSSKFTSKKPPTHFCRGAFAQNSRQTPWKQALSLKVGARNGAPVLQIQSPKGPSLL